jgi:sugar-specific transcriptional regulator TrmB
MVESKSATRQALDPQIKDALKNLGFTDYYINIYTCLLIDGEMNAHDLSEKTGVPYSRIYEVLNEMIKKCLITKIDARPSTFIANNPEEMFQELKKQQDEAFQVNMQTSLSFLNQISVQTGEAKEIPFSLHQGRKLVLDHIRNGINGAVKTLLIAFKEIDDVFPDLEKHLDFCKIKGVQMKFLVKNSIQENIGVLNKLKKMGEVKFTECFGTNLIIADEKLAMQGMKGHFNIAKPSEQDYVLFSSTNTLFAMELTELFLIQWNSCKFDIPNSFY